MYEYIKSEVEKAVPEAINKRHIIHRNPELSFHEFNTSSLVCETLSELGIEFQSGLAGTGVLGIINGLKHEDNSKTVLIRARGISVSASFLRKKQWRTFYPPVSLTG